jgi:hypothetical protein
MKAIIFLPASLFFISIQLSCHRSGARYVDVNTGRTVTLKKDTATGLMVNAETGRPVDIYVDTETKDTIYGKTGKVINGRVVKLDNGTYTFRDTEEINLNNPEGESYKIKEGDYKKKVEKDGDVIIKTGNKKIKIDGETGERKVKKND